MMMELWDKDLKAIIINVPKGLKNTMNITENKESYKKNLQRLDIVEENINDFESRGNWSTGG